MDTLMLKFPDVGQSSPSAFARMRITYPGDIDEKKDAAIRELLREYDAKFLRLTEDSKGRLFIYEIPRKYLIHAINKLRRANFTTTEGFTDGTGTSDSDTAIR